jgi:hypothetical protein
MVIAVRPSVLALNPAYVGCRTHGPVAYAVPRNE